MALRLNQKSIIAGKICNQTKGETRILLKFTDGFRTEIMLKGNPWRDIAGRVLTIKNTKADRSLQHEEMLAPEDQGIAGDITAAKKVKVPTISHEELIERFQKREKFPYVWKNSLYLEWFTLRGERVVLEASDFDMKMSQADWDMTDEDEATAHKSASDAMTGFMDQLVNLDISREELDNVTRDKEELDEFDWEQLMKHSDGVTDRYMELMDKYENDHEKVAELMGWQRNPKKEDKEIFEIEIVEVSEEWKGGDELEPADDHPLQLMVNQLLNDIGYPADMENDQHRELWSAVATVGAKLAGALSGYHEDGTFDDNGFAIAQLKRVLLHINKAMKLMQNSHPKQSQTLMVIREQIIDLQQALRNN